MDVFLAGTYGILGGNFPNVPPRWAKCGRHRARSLRPRLKCRERRARDRRRGRR
jgi:hypothetical protein